MLEFFAKLFRRRVDTTRKSARLASTSEELMQSDLPGGKTNPEETQLVAAVGQSVGLQREHNEDCLLALTGTIAGKSSNMPFGLYVVADGMGGHDFGEVASNTAIRVIAAEFAHDLHTYLLSLPTQQPEASLEGIMEGAIKEAHRSVQRDAPGSGTTVTAALVMGGQITIGHVGDSRAYTIHPDGHVKQLTQDHSLVQRLEELGHLNKEEAASFPHRNVLIRALGQGDSLEVDVLTLPFPEGGTLMLCTDGLWGVIREEDIRRSVMETMNLPQACHSLVSAANMAGGPDNISVVLTKMVG